MTAATFFDALQAEQAEWSARNFPDALPLHPFLGIVEECGELAENLTDPEAVFDAVADTVIFASDFCTRHGLRLAEAMEAALLVAAFPGLPSLLVCLSQLARAQLKLEQGIRGTRAQQEAARLGALAGVLGHMVRATKVRGRDIEEVVGEVWARVRERDWVAYPLTGRAP